MTTVQQLLDEKGHDVWTIHPDSTVFDAIELMASKDVGALVVLENERPVGIFTERHYARNVVLKGKSSPKTRTRDIMTSDVVCARPGQTVEQCMAIMTDKRVRHLPVLDKGHLVGILSIGDLVKSIIADQNFAIDQLEHYIRS